jgi:hypothetical protein
MSEDWFKTRVFPEPASSSGASHLIAPPIVEELKELPSNSGLMVDRPKSISRAVPSSSIKILLCENNLVSKRMLIISKNVLLSSLRESHALSELHIYKSNHDK